MTMNDEKRASVSSQFDELEKALAAARLDLRDSELARLRAKLEEIKRVLSDDRGTPEERLEWLREFLAHG
jgi:hypothetical protein